MATGDADRLHLYEIARDRWRDEPAARTLMDLLPADRDQLVTKTDLAALRLSLSADIAEVSAQLATFEARFEGMNQRFDDMTARFEARLDSRIEGVRAEMHEMRADLMSRLGDQTKALVITAITMWLSVVGLILGLRLG